MFTEFGYFKEYYIGNKFIGVVDCKKDREKFGHFGSKKEVLEEDIETSNKRKIKKGTAVMTMIFPYCGIKSNSK
jgi:hypothetical protein